MTNTIKKIVVDSKLCTGAGTCASLAPLSFELNKEGIAVVKATALESSDEQLLSAARSCPVQAIFLYDEAGKQLS